MLSGLETGVILEVGVLGQFARRQRLVVVAGVVGEDVVIPGPRLGEAHVEEVLVDVRCEEGHQDTIARGILLVVEDAPAAEVPIGLVFEGQLLAAFAAYDIDRIEVGGRCQQIGTRPFADEVDAAESLVAVAVTLFGGRLAELESARRRLRHG